MVDFIIIIVLCAITFEDFRYRAVRLLFFPLLGGFLIASRLSVTTSEILAIHVAINVTYLLFLFAVSFLFLWFRNRRLKKPFGHYIGMGDIFLLLALSCWLEPVSFIVFNIVSLLAALVIHLTFKRFTVFYNKTETIPLAGVQSICFLIVFASNLHFY